MKIFFKLFITIFFLIFITLTYLSIFGVETDKFNSQITEKIRKFDKNLEVELKEIKLILDPLQFKLQAKTIGTNLINQSKKIEIENIKTQLSLKSLIEDKFSIENLEISSKSLELKNLISFLRSFKNTPELFIMEKAIKKGYLIADIKLEFDSNGNIKNNYEINGIVKDVELNVLKKYNLHKLDFIFDYSRNNFLVKDLNFKFDKIGFYSEKVSIKKRNDDFIVDGTFAHKKSDLDKRNIDLLIKPFLPNFDIEKISLSSNNNFSFEIQKGFKFENFKINSEILVHELNIPNNFKLKKIEELYKLIGNGTILPSKIISSLFPEKKLLENNEKVILLNKVKEKKEDLTSSIQLSGLTPGMSIHYAKCCLPIPGDDVLAFIIEGKGLMIHHDTCDDLKKIKVNKSKILRVSWDRISSKKDDFIAKINVSIKNKIGSLGNLSSIIGKSKSNIRNLKITNRTNDFFSINLEIDVLNKDHLNKILGSLRTSEYIEAVTRL